MGTPSAMFRLPLSYLVLAAFLLGSSHAAKCSNALQLYAKKGCRKVATAKIHRVIAEPERMDEEDRYMCRPCFEAFMRDLAERRPDLWRLARRTKHEFWVATCDHGHTS